MTVMRHHQITIADVTQCANLPLEASTEFEIFAGTNPSDIYSLGEDDGHSTYSYRFNTKDFDEGHLDADQQYWSDVATELLREIIGDPHLLRLSAPPNIYDEDNRVGDGSLHHDPRYRFDPEFGPQPV